MHLSIYEGVWIGVGVGVGEVVLLSMNDCLFHCELLLGVGGNLIWNHRKE